MFSSVLVTFKYKPENPDPEHESGMAEEELNDLTAKIFQLGGSEISIDTNPNPLIH